MDAVQEEYRTLDVCLSHPSPFGQYHYHAWSPCLKTSWSGSTTDAPALCKDTDGCTLENLSQFILDAGYYDSSNNGGIIGIAKDGHLLVGPYNNQGDLWSCGDFDICNGTYDANGNYVYAATGTFPYQLGCWGPAA